MQRADLGAITVEDAGQSLALINSVLGNQAGPALDIVKLNAGAAIYAAGLTSSLAEGVESAADVIASGKAKQTLESLVSISNSF